jgi:hypothetical protein
MANKVKPSSLGSMLQVTRNPNEPTYFGHIFKPDEG